MFLFVFIQNYYFNYSIDMGNLKHEPIEPHIKGVVNVTITDEFILYNVYNNQRISCFNISIQQSQHDGQMYFLLHNSHLCTRPSHTRSGSNKLDPNAFTQILLKTVIAFNGCESVEC